MLGTIKELIETGAVKQVEPVEKQFTFTIFLLAAINGSDQYRPVINLKTLNR